MTLCVYLQPDSSVAETAKEYSAQLAKLIPSSLVLGSGALPHVTLVHLSDVDDRVDEVWEKTRSVLNDEYNVEGPFYVSAIPFPDGSGHNFVRLEISRTETLANAQDALIELAGKLNANVTNLVGPAWRPHLTLAVTDSLPPHLPPFPEVSTWKGSPTLGSLGPFRHVDSVLRDRRSSS